MIIPLPFDGVIFQIPKKSPHRSYVNKRVDVHVALDGSVKFFYKHEKIAAFDSKKTHAFGLYRTNNKREGFRYGPISNQFTEYQQLSPWHFHLAVNMTLWRCYDTQSPPSRSTRSTLPRFEPLLQTVGNLPRNENRQRRSRGMGDARGKAKRLRKRKEEHVHPNEKGKQADAKKSLRDVYKVRPAADGTASHKRKASR
jgi:hypothetical protein